MADPSIPVKVSLPSVTVPKIMDSLDGNVSAYEEWPHLQVSPFRICTMLGGDDKMKNVSDSSLHWGMVSII